MMPEMPSLWDGGGGGGDTSGIAQSVIETRLGARNVQDSNPGGASYFSS